MPLSPPLVLEARSDTKFQLFPLFNIVGPFLDLIRNLGARHFPYFTSINKRGVRGEMRPKNRVKIR
jgi:hypothetical protein